jgi:hypothetical protein
MEPEPVQYEEETEPYREPETQPYLEEEAEPEPEPEQEVEVYEEGEVEHEAQPEPETESESVISSDYDSAPERSGAPIGLIAVILLVLLVGVGGTVWFFQYRPATAIPALSPAGGTYPTQAPVSISDATPHAVIHYTVDGSTPTETSAIYTQPIAAVPNGATIRAIAIADRHKASNEISGVYTWTESPPNLSQGSTYEQGENAFNRKQYAEARTYFKQSCDAGEMKGCSYLGYLFAQGLGGARNVQAAATVYLRACDHGTLASCVSLGQIYQDAEDNDNARRYFQKGCDGGLAEGCNRLKALP